MRLIIFLAVAFSIWLIWNSTVELKMKLSIDNAENYAFVVIRWLGGLINFRYNISLGTDAKKGWNVIFRKTDKGAIKSMSIQQVIALLKHWISLIKDLKSAALYIMSAAYIPYLSIRMSIGLYDAAVTALLTGSIISFMSILSGYARSKFNIDDIDINIRPNYADNSITVRIDGIMRLKISHIIIASIKAFNVIIKDKIKAVIKRWQNIPYRI